MVRARSFSRMFWSFGSYGASTGAAIAATTTIRKTTSPIHEVLLVLNAFSVAAAKYANGDGAGAAAVGPAALISTSPAGRRPHRRGRSAGSPARRSAYRSPSSPAASDSHAG